MFLIEDSILGNCHKIQCDEILEDLKFPIEDYEYYEVLTHVGRLGIITKDKNEREIPGNLICPTGTQLDLKDRSKVVMLDWMFVHVWGLRGP